MNNEKKLYYPNNKIKRVFKIITNHPDIIFYRAVRIFRKYYIAKKEKNKIKIVFYGIVANRYARKYNLELYGHYGKNLRIWHSNIIINGNAILGDNINLHGNNCIGNNGKDSKAPVIGNNVDVGYGAVIIGNIKIGNNVKIGANSTVTKSFEEGVTIAGSPAKVISKNEN